MDRNIIIILTLFLWYLRLGKFLDPMNILLILGSATENIVVCIGSRVSIWIASTTAMENFRFQL